jgi:GT2 family glycosyltransferase
MPRVSINLLGWNHDPQLVARAMHAVLAQSFDDFELVYSDNGSANGLLAFVRQRFGGREKVRLVDNGANLGYAGGHNRFFAEADSELVMVLNPDAHLHRDFLKHIVPAFDDPRVAAATGKMLKPQRNERGEPVLDGTGIVVERSRAARERGQLDVDRGQYDASTAVFGVSGTAAVYRTEALTEVKLFEREYFDEDFFAYYEDVDLSWRLRLAGYECRYVPNAIVYHTRVGSRRTGGRWDVRNIFAHPRTLSANVVRLSWRNHLFAIVKNDFGWTLWRDLPVIVVWQLRMVAYMLIVDRRILGAVPQFVGLLPRMLGKRRIIQSRRRVTSAQMREWFGARRRPRRL